MTGQPLGAAGSLVGARVRNSATQLITPLTITPMTFDTEVFDYGDCFQLATPTRLTAPVKGVYNITAGVRFPFNAAGYRRLAALVNGGSTAFATEVPTVNGDNTEIAIGAAWELAAGDYVEATLFQSSGVDLTIAAATNINFLAIVLSFRT